MLRRSAVIFQLAVAAGLAGTSGLVHCRAAQAQDAPTPELQAPARAPPTQLPAPAAAPPASAPDFPPADPLRAGLPAEEDARATDPPTPAATAGKPEEELCTLIETAATQHGLPVEFFTRLIWKESSFRSDAVSPKGAQGIAQFMPGTAAERGLDDPFDPAAAIPASASLLADLSARFGNLGLAAAAYNAGAQRVADWLADTGTLPWETQDYVLSITGVPAETWATPEDAPAKPAAAEKPPETCLALAKVLKVRIARPGPSIGSKPGSKGESVKKPWGVQVAGNFSRERAMSAYSALQKRFPALIGKAKPMVISGRMRGRGTRTFHHVRVPMGSREEADRFCAKLKAAGGSCVVLKT